MKCLLRSLVLLPLLAAPSAFAQSSTSDPMADILQGRMTFNFSTDIMNYFSANGIVLTYRNYNTTAKKGAGFLVVQGTMDMANGVGEVDAAGALILTQGTNQITMKNFQLDTSASAPVLSAMVIVNGSSAGRQPLFQLTASNPFAGPLDYGQYSTGATTFVVAPQFTSELNDYFTGASFDSSTVVGTINCNVLLTQASQ